LPASTNKIAAIRGRFEDWRALLAHIEKFAIMTIGKSGACGFAHFEMNRRELAFASLAIGRRATEDDDAS
jgi:hypothetical protein